ncbi:MAG: hypothetical protein AAFY71_14390 [Bacteroidota bacterium]
MADSQDIQSPAERVEAYLRRWMTSEEEIAFEEELRSDPDLMQLLDEQLVEMAQTQFVGMSEQAAQFDALFDTATFDYQQLRKIRIRNGVIIGGVAAAVIAGTIYILNPPEEESPAPEPTPTPEQTFDEVYQFPAFIPRDTLDKADTEEKKVLFGMVERGDSIFQQRNFEGASEAYQGIPIEFLAPQEQGRILFLQGISQLEAQQFDQAKSSLRAAQAKGLSQLTQQVQWYQSLLYLRQGQNDSAQIIIDSILQNNQHPYYIQAQSLRERLQEAVE